MSNITVFTQSNLVQFNTKAGVSEISAEAALFKGGAALAALKDVALDLALAKAHNGKYRAAAEILGVAFPSKHKAFTNLYKASPWANKAEMASYLSAMEGAEPGKSGWSKKQLGARALMAALRGIPAFTKVVEAEVIEA
jgi:hypothetical protein